MATVCSTPSSCCSSSKRSSTLDTMDQKIVPSATARGMQMGKNTRDHAMGVVCCCCQENVSFKGPLSFGFGTVCHFRKKKQ